MSENTGSGENYMMRNLALAAGGLCVSGALIYNHFKPERVHSRGEYYLDIVQNLDDCIAETSVDGQKVDVKYVMLGGGASAALMESAVTLDLTRSRITPPPKVDKYQYRTNKTQSDIDILVLSSDEKIIDAVRASLTPNQNLLNSPTATAEQRAKELSKPGAKLKVGVTGLDSGEALDEMPDGLSGKLARVFKKDWVSRRVEYADGKRFVSISDIKVELPDEYFEPWPVELKNGSTVPTLHPLIQVLCYLSRACHGVRARDIDKVTKIIDNIGGQFGASLVWGDKKETATLQLEQPVNDGVSAAIDYCNQKNALRWEQTSQRLGKKEAALLAMRIALHRQLDTREFFIQFGQGGWLYDHVLSQLSGEKQQEIQYS